MNEAELFGQLVRATRKSQKMNLGQLAEKANTGVKHLGRIERGEKQPSFELIVALARALNVSPATFFHYENAHVDSKFLTQQLQALLTKRDAKQLRKAYRVLQATLEP
jgi:transcriptional regulator with XRE-family HTH domain